MDADRHTMETDLKINCIPYLRKAGFKGTFPNFYRDTDGFVALVNFQFYSAGGSFCINLGYADPHRENVLFQKDTQISKLRINQTKDRVRLGAPEGGDQWFSFGETNYNETRGEPRSIEELSLICTELLSSQAEDWWRTKQTSKV